MPRIIAIGDIHGCSDALERLIEEVNPQGDDVVVALGDFVDRGPNSYGVIEILLELVTRCRFVPLIGNHELMMFKGLRDKKEFDFWFQHGGSQTLASYGGRVQNIPQHHLTFLSHCVRFFETDQHFFVHANYAPHLVLPEQPDELLFWEHITDFVPPPHASGKIAVVGHTPQLSGEIRNLGHVQIIDTFCYGDGWLSAVDLTSNDVWQATNHGDFRMGKLPAVEELPPHPMAPHHESAANWQPPTG
ncbi:MAG: metallophosphoesterase family protein [Planctomycetota bacterium]